MNERPITGLLRCEATIVAGKVLAPEAAEPVAPWVRPSPAQRRLLLEHAGADPGGEPWAVELQEVDDFVPMDLAGPPRFARERETPEPS